MKKIIKKPQSKNQFKQNFAYYWKAEFVKKFCDCMWDEKGEKIDVWVKGFVKGSDIIDWINVNFVYKAPKEINQTMVKKLRNTEQW